MPEKWINEEGLRHFLDVLEEANAQKQARYVTA